MASEHFLQGGDDVPQMKCRCFLSFTASEMLPFGTGIQQLSGERKREKRSVRLEELRGSCRAHAWDACPSPRADGGGVTSFCAQHRCFEVDVVLSQ